MTTKLRSEEVRHVVPLGGAQGRGKRRRRDPCLASISTRGRRRRCLLAPRYEQGSRTACGRRRRAGHGKGEWRGLSLSQLNSSSAPSTTTSAAGAFALRDSGVVGRETHPCQLASCFKPLFQQEVSRVVAARPSQPSCRHLSSIPGSPETSSLILEDFTILVVRSASEEVKGPCNMLQSSASKRAAAHAACSTGGLWSRVVGARARWSPGQPAAHLGSAARACLFRAPARRR